MIYRCYRTAILVARPVTGSEASPRPGSTNLNTTGPTGSRWCSHVERDKARGAYNSAMYLTPRRRMLEAWAAHIMRMLVSDRMPTAAHDDGLANAERLVWGESDGKRTSRFELESGVSGLSLIRAVAAAVRPEFAVPGRRAWSRKPLIQVKQESRTTVPGGELPGRGVATRSPRFRRWSARRYLD